MAIFDFVFMATLACGLGLNAYITWSGFRERRRVRKKFHDAIRAFRPSPNAPSYPPMSVTTDSSL